MLKIIEGNIIDSKTDYIIHQVNCMGVMRSGVAKALRDFDEGIYIHYRLACENQKFNSEILLGTYDVCPIKQGGQIVLSLFAQNGYGYDGKQYTDIEAFRKGLNTIRSTIPVFSWKESEDRVHHTSIALPYKIGSVRGGANWDEVYKIIEEELGMFNVELWRLEEENV